MGGDGGQVIDRATMVKTKGWGLTNNRSSSVFSASLGEMANYVQMVSEDTGYGKIEAHRTRMTQCFLSQEALRDPVVACRLGNLYNKEAMIGALLNRKIPPGLSHIKKLSDLKNCSTVWKEAENDDGKKHLVCPISRDELDAGSSHAVVIWPTGAIVGLKSLKITKVKECPVTGKPFDFEQDVITLAPDEDELKKLIERLPAAAKKRLLSGEKGAEASATAAVKAQANNNFGAKDDAEATAAKKQKKEAAESIREGTNNGWSNHKQFDYLTNSEEAEFFGCTDTTATNMHKKEKQFAKPFLEKEKKRREEEAKAGKAGNDDGLFKQETKDSKLYKSLFCNDREAMAGPRDAFGKPIYNQGSRCL